MLARTLARAADLQGRSSKRARRRVPAPPGGIASELADGPGLQPEVDVSANSIRARVSGRIAAAFDPGGWE